MVELGTLTYKVEDDIGDETALEKTEKRAGCEEGGAPGQPELGHGDDAPEDHDCGNPSIRAELLADELGGKFGAQERETENGVSEVEVVGSKTEILEEVVCVRLRNVASIEVKSEKGDEGPKRDLPVKLVDQGLEQTVSVGSDVELSIRMNIPTPHAMSIGLMDQTDGGFHTFPWVGSTLPSRGRRTPTVGWQSGRDLAGVPFS